MMRASAAHHSSPFSVAASTWSHASAPSLLGPAMTLPADSGTTSWNPTATISGPSAAAGCPGAGAASLGQQCFHWSSQSCSFRPGGGFLPATLYVPACGANSQGITEQHGAGVPSLGSDAAAATSRRSCLLWEVPCCAGQWEGPNWQAATTLCSTVEPKAAALCLLAVQLLSDCCPLRAIHCAHQELDIQRVSVLLRVMGEELLAECC